MRTGAIKEWLAHFGPLIMAELFCPLPPAASQAGAKQCYLARHGPFNGG
jgi:hypothetical protein